MCVRWPVSLALIISAFLGGAGLFRPAVQAGKSWFVSAESAGRPEPSEPPVGQLQNLLHCRRWIAFSSAALRD